MFKMFPSSVRIFLSAILSALLLVMPGTATAQEIDPVAALRAQDIRLAQIADHMLEANQALCKAKMPLTGMILHSSDQYSDPHPDWFANGNFAIAAVLPGSAADEAGLQANDALLSIGGTDLEGLPTIEDQPRRDAAYGAMMSAESDQSLPVTFRRGEETSQLSLDAPVGCRSLVEVLTTNGTTARSDGRVIQISYGLADRLEDQELAVVFAHELAHTVLEHRRRLMEAGVSKGLLGEFGRNRRLNRQVELEADRLAVHLLANAGYDPAIAPKFWRSDAGRRAGGGMLRSWIYPSRSERAELLEEEIRLYLHSGSVPTMASHLVELRDQPFDQD